MLGFGLVASVPALIISKLISPRRRYNPVKFLPMECGQVPSGEGRTHFMMQYYAYILMFVVFDVMAIFLYIWGVSLFSIPRVGNAANDGLSGYNVFSNGLCVISIREEGNLVDYNRLINIKYLDSRRLGEWPC